MKRFVLVLQLFCLLTVMLTVLAQDIFTLGKITGFNDYYDNPIPDNLSFAYKAEPEAEAAVRKIMSYTGLPAKFSIRAAGVANASATIDESTGQQLILYNQEFMQEMDQTTGTGWAATSIMAHEIGHHLAGHTMKLVLLTPEEIGDTKILELEADRFSGYVLERMGAELNEAKAALEAFNDVTGSKDYPAKADRLAAVSNGWYAARDGESPFTIERTGNTPPVQPAPVQPLPAQPTPPAPQPAIGTVPVTRNADWTPVPKNFDGTTMMLVPAGSFEMGSENGYSDEKPVHRQSIEKPYWIDETEVTREAYGSCVSAGVCESKSTNQWSDSPNQPINRVTWYQAAKYCSWRGARLPTEVEWEYAARGPDNLIYPWGNEFEENKVHGRHNSGNETANVGNYPDGESWIGALDMSGNVWEWTSSLYKEYPYVNDNNRNISGSQKSISENIALRGGSFIFTTDYLRASNRFGSSAVVGSNYLGFRCARSNSVP